MQSSQVLCATGSPPRHPCMFEQHTLTHHDLRGAEAYVSHASAICERVHLPASRKGCSSLLSAHKMIKVNLMSGWYSGLEIANTCGDMVLHLALVRNFSFITDLRLNRSLVPLNSSQAASEVSPQLRSCVLLRPHCTTIPTHPGRPLRCRDISPRGDVLTTMGPFATTWSSTVRDRGRLYRDRQRRKRSRHHRPKSLLPLSRI